MLNMQQQKKNNFKNPHNKPLSLDQIFLPSMHKYGKAELDQRYINSLSVKISDIKKPPLVTVVPKG